jgi:hypothetical protein
VLLILKFPIFSFFFSLLDFSFCVVAGLDEKGENRIMLFFLIYDTITRSNIQINVYRNV